MRRKFTARVIVPVGMVALAGLVLAGCSSTTSTASTPSASSAASTKVTNVRYIYNNTAPIPAYAVAQAEGLFGDNSVKVSEIDLADPGAATTALLANQADMADVPLPTAMLAIQKGAAIKIVGAQSYGFSDAKTKASYQAAILAAPKSTGITSIKDLAGKTIAVASLGSEYYFELEGVLEKAGIAKTDVKFVAVPYTGMVAALASHQADAALMLSTNFGTLNATTPSVNIASGSSLLGLPIEVPSVLAVRTDFAKAHPAAVSGFLAGLVSAENWVQKDLKKNQGASARTILQAATKYPDVAMDSYMKLRVDGLGKESEYTNPLSVPSAVIDAQTKLLHQSGQLATSAKITDKQVVDNAPLKAAFAKLGMKWQTSPKLPD
jgi:ABC-type nitrate/sulfonate/bicarbonate transport system substrate-binding protein